MDKPNTGGRPLRAIPDGFAQDAVALSRNDLKAKYQCSGKTAARWIEELGLPAKLRGKIGLKPVPADFVRKSGEMNWRALQIHYRTAGRTITRWRKETGIASLESQARSLQRTRVEEAKRARAAKPKAASSIESGKIGWSPGAIPARDDTIHGEAADFLRRKGWVVFRARTLRACAGKDDWIVGRLTLRARDMVAKAVAKGFEHGR